MNQNTERSRQRMALIYAGYRHVSGWLPVDEAKNVAWKFKLHSSAVDEVKAAVEAETRGEKDDVS